ncbi:Choline/ethanolaminephosphotransferase [Neocallimastix lanati (nom. inval.)]|uniref:Choline/ethanolaminephosphotransferase n=1 Tax=Neocallimastix californiae TaxID=1754190 RepID=A0A1Y2CUF2_9FUNG|nr:Choline/ethanolaminephosphotransferase [Neocallimastix sp. JGI-2020a]ORY50661.1 Choline/ethanolaminephosphotransferase [Neocallimastix californiae]|eukprot:ORY50661.1 Choline/ethanolaminephosphotransferase [Neocallimastix californiae]
MIEYIKDSDIKALKKYKYSSVDKSLIQKYILNPYWCWLVEKVPIWVAPNLITLSGFMFMVVSIGLLLMFGSNWEEVPRWVYVCWGINLFIYQSLDAIDGKQARRTGSSGPLGELFDHGCDAINTTLAFLCILSALGIGNTFTCVLTVLAALTNFYVSSWETYHTHTLFLSYISGPVEGILSGCILLITTGFVGPKFWSNSINQMIGTSSEYLNFPFYNLVCSVIGVMALFNVVCSAINVVNYTKDHNESLLKKSLGLVPHLFICGFVMLWAKSSSTLIENNLLPFFLFIGFCFGHQVGLIILYHVAKKSFPYWNRMYNFLVAAGLVLKVQNYRDAIIDLLKGEGLNVVVFERYIMWGLFAVAFMMYMEFALYVINRLCGIFDINCLSIKHPKINMNTKNEKPVYTVSTVGKKLISTEAPLVSRRRRNRM